jgi:hypothetical protein
MSNEDFYNYGLFGIINHSDVHDTNIVNCNININSSASSIYIGTLAGEIENSNIFNCSATGIITATRPSEANVYDICIGGLCGGIYDYYSTISFENCKSDVDINFSNFYTGNKFVRIGGLVGQYSGENININNCFYTGNIEIINYLNTLYVAGLVGELEAYSSDNSIVLSNSYFVGNITVQNCTWGYIGGLFAVSISSVELNNCFSSCNIVVGEIISSNVGGLIGYQGNDSSAITNCYSAHGSILIGAADENSSVGGLIGNFYYSWWGNTNSLTDCYSGNIVKVSSPANPNNIGSFIGETDAATISNCYFDKDLSEYVSASENTNETNIIGLTTDQMTGYSALKNMSGLFEVTDSNTTVAFDISDNPDVIVDGIYYAHYPHIKYFTSGKNFSNISNSEYSTRAKILNTEQIAKEISFIDETSHRMKGMLKIMRMF